jgi:hypothetical protein
VITDVIHLYDALLQYTKDMRALVVASVNASSGTTAGTNAAKQQAADDKLLSYTDAAEAWYVMVLVQCYIDCSQHAQVSPAMLGVLFLLLVQ